MNYKKLKNASWTTSWNVDAKDEIYDTIERLSEAEIQQIVKESRDEESQEYVDQIEEEQ